MRFEHGKDFIHVVSITLPGYSDLGTANVYIVGPEPVTLIDTAPKFPGSFESLREGLRRGGYAIDRVDRIVLTHAHVDHFGLAARIREEVGRPIPCFVHAEEQARVVDPSYREELFDEEGDRLMEMVGMPPEEVQRVRERFAVFTLLADPVPDARAMEDGDRFAGEGYELEVIHTPGHTPGSCCLYERRRKVLFSGDHLLRHITPNPIYELKRSRLRDPGYRSLEAYMKSLDRVEDLEISHVFPGHGEGFDDVPGLVAGYRKHHRERMEKIWTALKRASRPLYRIVDEVFDFVPETDGFLAISEILVHLEMLVEEGRAELVDPGPPALYRAIDRP